MKYLCCCSQCYLGKLYLPGQLGNLEDSVTDMLGCSYVLFFVVGLALLLDSRVLCLWFGDLIVGFMGV